MDAKTRPRACLLGRLAALAAASCILTAGPRTGAQLLPDLPIAVIPGSATEPGVTVQSRLRPAFDPIGIQAGAARIYPQLDESLGFDSALLGAQGGRSLVLQTHPSVRLAADDPDHPFGLTIDLTNARTPALPAQSRTDASVAAGGALPVADGRLSLGASDQFLHQNSTDLDALPSDEPIAFRVQTVEASYARSWDRLTLTPSLSLASWRFSNATIGGAAVSQAYRDRIVLRSGLTASYEVMPLRNLVVTLRDASQFYTETPTGAPTSNSRQIGLLAGIDDASDGLWHYRLLAGWERRSYGFGGFASHSAGVGEADVVLTPDEMTTLTASLTRSIEDAAQEGSAGFVYTSARLTADYEWRRDVLLEATGALERAALLQPDGRQTIATAGVQVTWLLNRRLRLIGSTTVWASRSAGEQTTLGGSFVRTLSLLTVRVGL